MDTLRTIVLVLHVSAAAVLVAANTGLLRNLRRTLELSRGAFLIAVEDAARRGKLMRLCSAITLLTGVALIMIVGGMKAVPLNIHIALTLMISAIIVSLTVMMPSVKKLVKLAQAEVPDKDVALGNIKKLAMGQGILHLLWVSTLTLMFVRIYK